ncbi:MAG: transcription termination factor NusA [Verrucomicrobiae bacterium]|nr:transcription termination factor NusA [Verrucomicrobiae bacterium]
MNGELLALLDYLQREKGLDREELIQAIEQALLQACRKALGSAREPRIVIDRTSGHIRAYAKLTATEVVRDRHTEISLQEARRFKPDVQPGEWVEVEVTPENLGRIAAQTARQTMNQLIRRVERSRVIAEYQNRVGDIVSGTVRRFERGDVFVDVGRIEAVMPSRERVPTEQYQIGDQIRCLVLSVTSSGSNPEIILSRGHPNFVKRLFELEVAEINDKTVEIRAIAREAGHRTKIAVASKDDKVDPVGACVGMRGMRVRNIVRELGGEKIDIIRWAPDIRQFVANALAPAKLKDLTVDEARHAVKVLVDPDQLSLAIGKKGQNARLAAKLTGWNIEIEKEETAVLDFEAKKALAIASLEKLPGLDHQTAELLVNSGFHSVEGLMDADAADLAEVLGEERAQAVLRALQEETEKQSSAAGS